MSREEFDRTANMSREEYREYLEKVRHEVLSAAPTRRFETEHEGLPSVALFIVAAALGTVALVLGLGADYLWGCADHFCGVELNDFDRFD